MSTAEELRTAATRLREAADEATTGPWSVGNGEVIGLNVKQTGRGSFTADALLARVIDDEQREEDNFSDWRLGSAEADAQWIALASPALAEPLAEWLETEAHMWEKRGNNVEGHTFHALKVARAINDTSAPAPVGAPATPPVPR